MARPPWLIVGQTSYYAEHLLADVRAAAGAESRSLSLVTISAGARASVGDCDRAVFVARLEYRPDWWGEWWQADAGGEELGRRQADAGALTFL